MYSKNHLRVSLDEKLEFFKPAVEIEIPPTGWLKVIRLALNISLEQLGKKMSMTKQGIDKIESREREGKISINTLREMADALDMELVYGFVPKDGSLDALIDRKAYELAYRMLKPASKKKNKFELDTSDEQIKKEIHEKAIQIKQEMPDILWD